MSCKITALLAFVLAICIASAAAPARAQTVSVGLFFGAAAPHSVAFRGQGDWEAHGSHSRFSGAYTVTVEGRELAIAKQGERSARVGRWLNLAPAHASSSVTLGDTAYRGLLKLDAQPTGGIRVVNIVDMESYLQGVIPNEMFSIPRALQALEVQAVVSRTLAMFIESTQPRHPGAGFDVCNTGHCQVYRGASSETTCGNDAVQRTRGQVLTYQGKVILAAYIPNAGGHTAPTDEAWPGSLRVKYLTPVVSPYDDYAAAFQYGDCYQWKELVQPEQIRQRVQRVTGERPGEVRDLVAIRSESGRIRELRVAGSAKVVKVSGPRNIRFVLGLLQETTGKAYDHDTRLVSIHKMPQGFTISGYGAGEGVGLSQHGAVGMANARFSYREILGHYYRGVSLSENYGAGRSVALRPPDMKPRQPETTKAIASRE
jgi:stage II sporulation protein D